MPIDWYTKNINIQDYYKAFRRIVMFNGHDSTHLSGKLMWDLITSKWRIRVFSAADSAKFAKYYEHLNIEPSTGMAWGVTGLREMALFLVDSRNPRIMMQNIMPCGHELNHAIMQEAVGTTHIMRKFDTPDGKAGTKGPAATVVVHDNWYGSKIMRRFWIWKGFMWVRITYPYIPVWQAKQKYNL